MFYNPLRLLSPVFSRFRMTAYDLRVQKNSYALRNFVRIYIEGRKRGEN